MRTILLFALMLQATLAVAQFTWDSLPPKVYPDSLHHPFIIGVASNEPYQTEVSIWTYAAPDFAGQVSKTISYEVASDTQFTNIISSGTLIADSMDAYTASTRITGLNPDQYYWYRFSDSLGNYSVIGRTRTLPDNPNNIKFAVTSCSAFFAGYFNGYNNMSKRNLNAVIHLGDFIYDEVDIHGAFRFPTPKPQDPHCELDQRHERLFLYMLDADMRRVRQLHPFIQIWDNHDVETNADSNGRLPCIDAFRDFTAMPVFDTSNHRKIYRKISIGNLVDLFMIDEQWPLNHEPAPGVKTYLGFDQLEWFKTELESSTAKWKLVGTQKMFTNISVPASLSSIPQIGSIKDGGWNSFDDEREGILRFIDSLSIDNVMFMGGDVHFAEMSDLPVDVAKDSMTSYNEATRDGSVAVTFLPTSLSGGNLDEVGLLPSLNTSLVGIARSTSPYIRFLDFVENGYGLLNIDQDKVVAQIWFHDVKEITEDEWLAHEALLFDGDNHYYDPPVNIDKPTVEEKSFEAYPNPTQGKLYVNWYNYKTNESQIKVLNLNGQVYYDQRIVSEPGSMVIKLDLDAFPQGMYIVQLIGERTFEKRVVKQ